MASVAELGKKIKVAMFDQYGTVVDTQASLTAIAAPFLKAKAAGMHSAFSDRRKRPFGGTPYPPGLWVDDMRSLAGAFV